VNQIRFIRVCWRKERGKECSYLVSISFGAQVVSLGARAVSRKRLKSVEIPF